MIIPAYSSLKILYTIYLFFSIHWKKNHNQLTRNNSDDIIKKYDKERSCQMNSDVKQTKDDFWDLSRLTPQRSRKISEKKPRVELPLITQTETGSGHDENGIPIPPQKKAPTVPVKQESVIKNWQPSHPLIRNVTVRPWRSSFSYYEGFLHDALALYAKKGNEVPHEPFFSYVPQYDQLNSAQLLWYLFWRDSCRNRHVYLPTDESYIVLYLYEIINLSDATDVHAGLDQLLAVWHHYHKIYPVLNKYLCEWIIDYCMIHSLDLSAEQAAAIDDDMIASCSMKEFYLSFDMEKTEDFSAFLLKNVSAYHYEQSKYYKNESVSLYDTHVPAVLRLILEDTAFSEKIKKHLQLQSAKIIRDAYVGALCSCANKRKLEIEYLSFSKRHKNSSSNFHLIFQVFWNYIVKYSI